jgi:hypothetical protein
MQDILRRRMHVTICILVRRVLLKYYIYFPISISMNYFLCLHSFLLELPLTWASWRRLNLLGSGAIGIIWTISSVEREREREGERERERESERERERARESERERESVCVCEKERERESEYERERERENYIYTHQLTCSQKTNRNMRHIHRDTQKHYSNTGYLECRVRTLVSL